MSGGEGKLRHSNIAFIVDSLWNRPNIVAGYSCKQAQADNLC
jgi:hypothetical protein